MEGKVLKVKIEEGKLIIDIDPNKDGQVVMSVSLDLAEVIDEVASIFKKKEA